MNPYDVLLKPIVSEKADFVRDNESKYCFQVSMNANKKDVSLAVAKLFNVKVTSVRTLVVRGKIKTRRLKGGMFTEGKRANVKKAFVTAFSGKTGNKPGKIKNLEQVSFTLNDGRCRQPGNYMYFRRKSNRFW